MEFQRARNEEQKQLRTRQIVDAAARLLQQHSYRDITLDMIASGLDFSRANMARYAATKEEIFLLLYLREMGQLCREAAEGYEGPAALGKQEFAAFFVEKAAKYENFLHINSILNTIIELNIEPERLAVYKAEMYQNLELLAAVLLRSFAFLTPETTQQLITQLSEYLAGLYPVTRLTPCQRQAIQLSGISYRPKQFEQELERFIVLLLSGYEALAEEK